MALVDTSHRFFHAAWRRNTLVAFCWCWSGFELYLGNTFWVMLFVAISVYLTWILVLKWEKPKQSPED